MDSSKAAKAKKKKKARAKAVRAAEAALGPPPPATLPDAPVLTKREKRAEKAASKAAAGAGAAAEVPELPDDATWEDLGLHDGILAAVKDMKWKAPSAIQRKALPPALAGRDVIGLAETGSGKTGAFVLPVLQKLLQKPQRLFALCLAPTRELAFGIAEQFEALGTDIQLQTAVIVGGVDMITQSIALARKPHVVVATPGRLVDHLENTKGFSLMNLKVLVLDEADRMLSMDFEEPIDTILSHIPRTRTTYLYSATMTTKVAKLQRASLVNPARVEASSKYTTVGTLIQHYLFLPAKHKDCYLAYVLNEFKGKQGIIFTATCANAQRVCLMLQNLGFSVASLHGQMSQSNRLGALNKFKAGARQFLVATEVASRGLDIPAVDMVVNFELPPTSKDYVHRVGRTARAGRTGRAVSFVTQYDVEQYQRIEKAINQKLPAYECDEDAVLLMLERVTEAQRMAALEMREGADKKGKRGRKRGGDEPGDDAAEVLEDSMHRRKKLATAMRRNKSKGRR